VYIKKKLEIEKEIQNQKNMTHVNLKLFEALLIERRMTNKCYL